MNDPNNKLSSSVQSPSTRRKVSSAEAKRPCDELFHRSSGFALSKLARRVAFSRFFKRVDTSQKHQHPQPRMPPTKHPDWGKPFFYDNVINDIREDFKADGLLADEDAIKQFDAFYKANHAEATKIFGEQVFQLLWYAHYRTVFDISKTMGKHMTAEDFIETYTALPPAMDQAQLAVRRGFSGTVPKSCKANASSKSKMRKEAASESSKSMTAAFSGAASQDPNRHTSSIGQASKIVAVAQKSKLAKFTDQASREIAQLCEEFSELDTQPTGLGSGAETAVKGESSMSTNDQAILAKGIGSDSQNFGSYPKVEFVAVKQENSEAQGWKTLPFTDEYHQVVAQEATCGEEVCQESSSMKLETPEKEDASCMNARNRLLI